MKELIKDAVRPFVKIYILADVFNENWYEELLMAAEGGYLRTHIRETIGDLFNYYTFDFKEIFKD